MQAEPETPPEGFDYAEAKRQTEQRNQPDRAEQEQETMDGAALIAAERRRQVEAEGWTPEQIQRFLKGSIEAAKRISARVEQLADESKEAL